MSDQKNNKPASKSAVKKAAADDYVGLLGGIGELLETARRASARAVNAFMTATYWEVGRRIVEFEQGGAKRAGYDEELLERLSQDLIKQYGRGFARPNLIRFRQFYQAFPAKWIRSTVLNESSAPTAGRETPRRRTRKSAQAVGGADMIIKTFEQMQVGKAHQLFGDQLPKLLDELNEVLAA